MENIFLIIVFHEDLDFKKIASPVKVCKVITSKCYQYS